MAFLDDPVIIESGQWKLISTGIYIKLPTGFEAQVRPRSGLALKKGITKIICIAVNDPNVMKAWGENQNVEKKILMAGDPFLKFTKAIGAEVDKSAKGLGIRSNRYTMLVENGEVKRVEEEKETASCELSSAENFLKSL